MSTKNKGKNGNGAKTENQTNESRNLPTQKTESSRLQASRIEHHPMTRFRREMDALFDRFFGPWPSLFDSPMAPADWSGGLDRFWDVDIQDTDKDILVRAEAPGLEPKDFDINVTGNTLTIRAEHKQEKQENQEGYRYSERRMGQFHRSISLPAAVKAGEVEAHYRNGVLELRLPRAEVAQRRRIEVKS
ncbi:MAG: Hsp20/alpha crystallin family protein [Gemmataceae bacterium]